MDPLAAKDAVNPRPFADSKVLKASIELTLLAAGVLLMVTVVAAPVAGVKMKVLPSSEFVPPLVISAAVPYIVKPFNAATLKTKMEAVFPGSAD
jgi:hypothetical protein